MHSTDWRDLLGRLPSRLQQLRDAAEPSRLQEVEARLGSRLPAPYRSLLQVADGGWLGDQRLYGTTDLLALLRGADGGALPVRTRIVGLGWPRPMRRLVPFHPVDRHGIECLDLDRPGHPVVWCHHDEITCAGFWGGFDDIHPLARRILSWGPGAEPSMADTYGDFLDWVLDVVYDLHFSCPPRLAAGDRG